MPRPQNWPVLCPVAPEAEDKHVIEDESISGGNLGAAMQKKQGFMI